MENLSQPDVQPAFQTGLNLEYLLKELEFQVSIETRARDRMENMVQYLLTTIAAVLGAALLVNEMQVNSALLFFIASFLMFVFSTSAFYRACRLRYITTYARVTRNKIRRSIETAGIQEANQLIEWEGNPSGFCSRMLRNLVSLMWICCLIGGASGFFALLLVFDITSWPRTVAGFQLVWLVILPITAIVGARIVLGVVLKNQKSKADQLITGFEWRNLPDYDL